MSNISKPIFSTLFTISVIILISVVSCLPVPEGDEMNKVNLTESTFETLTNQSQSKNQIVIERKNDGYLQGSGSYVNNAIENPSLAAAQNSVTNFFDTLRTSVKGLLQTGQTGLLRAIGTADQTSVLAQKGLQNASFTLVLEGQKVAAKLYDVTPTQINKLIQRIGTVRDNRMLQQFNHVVNQYRENSKKWFDAWEEHEYDFHNVFQNVWSTINHHLKVEELPRMPFGWY